MVDAAMACIPEGKASSWARAGEVLFFLLIDIRVICRPGPIEITEPGRCWVGRPREPPLEIRRGLDNGTSELEYCRGASCTVDMNVLVLMASNLT